MKSQGDWVDAIQVCVTRQRTERYWLRFVCLAGIVLRCCDMCCLLTLCRPLLPYEYS